jgi:hypothetical protein
MKIIYGLDTGAITGFLDTDLPVQSDWFAVPSGVIESAVEIDAGIGRTHYALDGALTARPLPACTLDKTTIIADGLDTATLSGIPAGSSVRVTDSNGTTDYTVNDGAMEITADEPGTITITVTPAFPYKPLTVTVTAS